jgi:hypothetical protein
MLGSDGGCHAIPRLGLWGPEEIVDWGLWMILVIFHPLSTIQYPLSRAFARRPLPGIHMEVFLI